MWRQETQDVLALLRVLADPFDTLAFGALMRGPLVGLTDRELLDITADLPPSKEDYPSYFTVQTDPELVRHPLASAVLKDLQDLQKRAAITTPSLILAEAIEKLGARVIIAARYRNRNARSLANLDALIERARPYAVSGLRAFVRDLQADWERRTRVPEGRVDAVEDAIEFVTIHSAKGLEWPVVIPINSTTQLRRFDQFVFRQSDNSLHWMLGGVAPPDLTQARAKEAEEEARQRERIWYVACTRARDLLIVPSIPQAAKASCLNAVDLRQHRVRRKSRAVCAAGNSWLRGERGHCTMARVPTIAGAGRAGSGRHHHAARSLDAHRPEGRPLTYRRDGSLLTHRWREMDSNLRFPVREVVISALAKWNGSR